MPEFGGLRFNVSSPAPLSTNVGHALRMWPSKWIGDQELQLLVERWRGTHAQAWEYSCSHSRFLLRLIREDEQMNPLSSAYILCYGCFSLQFDNAWKGVDLRIESTASNSRKNCMVTDREHLRIECSRVSAVETTVMPFIHLADQ